MPHLDTTPAPLSPAQEDDLLRQEYLAFFHEHLAALSHRQEELGLQRQSLHVQQMAAVPGSPRWVDLGQEYRAITATYQDVFHAWDAWRGEYRRFQQERRHKA